MKQDNTKEAVSTDVVVERTIDAPVEKLWMAISDPVVMKEWYFNVPDFRPVVGTKFQFLEGPPDKKYLHLCEVVEVVPERRLAYSWRFEGMPGESVVTFELTPEGNKTKIKLTHAGVESFAVSGDPNVSKASFTAGWTDLITRMLPEFMEKQGAKDESR